MPLATTGTAPWKEAQYTEGWGRAALCETPETTNSPLSLCTSVSSDGSPASIWIHDFI